MPESAVCNIADHAHRKWRVYGQHLFSINADLALPGNDRPVDLIVVLPRFDFGDVRNLIRLVLDRQIFRPANDRSWRNARVYPNWNSEPAVDGIRIVIVLNDPRRCQLILAPT